MRTLPMTMNPDNIFRPPARWALWLQNWLWLGFICCRYRIWYLFIYLWLCYPALFYLVQLSHSAPGWYGGVGQMTPQNANLCKIKPNQTRICLVKTKVNTGLIDGQSIQTLFESSREQRKSMMRVPTASSARQDFPKQQLKLLINLVFFYLAELMSATQAINSCLKHNNTFYLINELLR